MASTSVHCLSMHLSMRRSIVSRYVCRLSVNFNKKGGCDEPERLNHSQCGGVISFAFTLLVKIAIILVDEIVSHDMLHGVLHIALLQTLFAPFVKCDIQFTYAMALSGSVLTVFARNVHVSQPSSSPYSRATGLMPAAVCATFSFCHAASRAAFTSVESTLKPFSAMNSSAFSSFSSP